MRKQSLFTVLIIAVCSLTVLMAIYAFARTNNAEICDVAEAQTENIQPLSGRMLWESLSSQFVSAVHR